MPYRFKFFRPGETVPSFECALEPHQCMGTSKNGMQCRRRSVIGLPFCWTHLLSEKNLRIKASNIPDAGSGLFALKRNATFGEILFRTGDTIIKYEGEVIDQPELERRYGVYTAPYGVALHRHMFEDGACVRGVGNLANHATGALANARLVLDPRRNRVSLKAMKNIRNDQEILVNYGREYGFTEGTRYSTKPARG